MVAQVPLLAVNLTTACIESFFYGIFFLLTVLSVYLLVVRHNSAKTKRSIFLTPFFPSTLLIFATVTGVSIYFGGKRITLRRDLTCILQHWIVTFKRLFDALIYFNSGKTPVSYFANVRLPTEIAKTSFLVLTLFIGDSMIVSIQC